jgi:hypothetical protein
VIYLALEERMEEVREDFRAMGADISTPIKVHADTAPERAVLALIDLIREEKPLLVVVDPLFPILRVRDEKAYAEVSAALRPLIDVARATGTHLLLTHHASKATKSDAIDSPLGSTAIGGAVATLIYVRCVESQRLIKTVQRIGMALPETILNFDFPTRTLWLGGEKQEQKLLTVERMILDVVDHGEGKLEDQILASVKARLQDKRHALRSLVSKNQLLRTGAGMKLDPHRYMLPRVDPASENRERENENCGSSPVNADGLLVPKTSPHGLVAPRPAGTSIQQEPRQAGGKRLYVPAEVTETEREVWL